MVTAVLCGWSVRACQLVVTAVLHGWSVRGCQLVVTAVYQGWSVRGCQLVVTAVYQGWSVRGCQLVVTAVYQGWSVRGCQQVVTRRLMVCFRSPQRDSAITFNMLLTSAIQVCRRKCWWAWQNQISSPVTAMLAGLSFFVGLLSSQQVSCQGRIIALQQNKLRLPLVVQVTLCKTPQDLVFTGRTLCTASTTFSWLCSGMLTERLCPVCSSGSQRLSVTDCACSLSVHVFIPPRPGHWPGPQVVGLQSWGK